MDEEIYQINLIPSGKADKRMRILAKVLKEKTKDIHINRLLDLIISFPDGSLNKISSDKRYKDIIKYV